MISTKRYYAGMPGVAFPRYGTPPWGGSEYQWTVDLRIQLFDLSSSDEAISP
jgi:hypothetical protein